MRLRQGGRHDTAVDGRERADDDTGLQLLYLVVVVGTEGKSRRGSGVSWMEEAASVLGENSRGNR